LLEAPLCDHAGTLLERLGQVLRGVAPDGAAQEQRLAVDPLVPLLVERARRRRDREARDRDAGLGEAQLRVGGQVADNGDDGVVGHAQAVSFMGVVAVIPPSLSSSTHPDRVSTGVSSGVRIPSRGTMRPYAYEAEGWA